MAAPEEAGESLAVVLRQIRSLLGVSQSELSQILGTSLVSVARLERGDNQPNPETAANIRALCEEVRAGKRPEIGAAIASHVFASRGARSAKNGLPLFDAPPPPKARLPPNGSRRLSTGSNTHRFGVTAGRYSLIFSPTTYPGHRRWPSHQRVAYLLARTPIPTTPTPIIRRCPPRHRGSHQAISTARRPVLDPFAGSEHDRRCRASARVRRDLERIVSGGEFHS